MDNSNYNKILEILQDINHPLHIYFRWERDVLAGEISPNGLASEFILQQLQTETRETKIELVRLAEENVDGPLYDILLYYGYVYLCA